MISLLRMPAVCETIFPRNSYQTSIWLCLSEFGVTVLHKHVLNPLVTLWEELQHHSHGTGDGARGYNPSDWERLWP